MTCPQLAQVLWLAPPTGAGGISPPPGGRNETTLIGSGRLGPKADDRASVRQAGDLPRAKMMNHPNTRQALGWKEGAALLDFGQPGRKSRANCQYRMERPRGVQAKK